MSALLIALLLQEAPRPYEARIRVETWPKTGDRVSLREGRIRVRPGEAPREADRFEPIDLFRMTWSEIRKAFRVAGVEGEPPLPDAVSGPDGAPREPARVRLRGAAVASGAEERERAALQLVPRDASLRRRLPSIRVLAAPETLRIERAVFDSPTQVTVITLDGFREDGPMEGPLLEFDPPGVRVEER